VLAGPAPHSGASVRWRLRTTRPRRPRLESRLALRLGAASRPGV